ncbi:threonine/serine exporter family protein [Zhihengliuella sp.]|uniref:threonine/serine ThrE exporter family protein n=1 Tax=Zhihengliuella sp. TaxID=1954483 RepID=UPI002810D91C|nr:threonine/serine exporter family protein [Zhihengliuella sp.]
MSRTQPFEPEPSGEEEQRPRVRFEAPTTSSAVSSGRPAGEPDEAGESAPDRDGSAELPDRDADDRARDAHPAAGPIPRIATSQIANPLAPPPRPAPVLPPSADPADDRSQAEIEWEALNYGHGVTSTEGGPAVETGEGSSAPSGYGTPHLDGPAAASPGASTPGSAPGEAAAAAAAGPGPAVGPPPTGALRPPKGGTPKPRWPGGPVTTSYPSTGAYPSTGTYQGLPTQPYPGTQAHAAHPHTAPQPTTPAPQRTDGAGRGRLPVWRPAPSARRVFSRLLTTEHPPTQAFSIVDRLVGSPYANPTVQTGVHETDARETLEFSLDLAEIMFRFGGGALEAETSIIAVTASFGLRNVDVDITNQSIHINYAGDEVPISLLRVVRSWTNNYAGLALVHQLVTDIVAGDVTRREAIERLQEIARKPKPFPRWMADVGGGVFAGCFVLFSGGSLLGGIIAFLSWLGVSQLFKVSARWRIPEFFATAFASVLITTTALLLWRFHVPIEPSMVIAGGIMLLLPSARFVASAQDAINGFPVTAIGRLLPAMMIFAAIVAGIMTGIVIGDLSGIGTVDVTEASAIAYPTWFLILVVGLAITAGTVFEQSAPKLLLPTAAVSVLGYLTMLLVQQLGIGARLAPAAAAVVIGAAGRWVALRMEAPQMVVAVPAMMFLLPGLMIFRAMYGITVDSGDLVLGITQIMNAFGIILSIAAGIVLGDTIARPLTKGWNSHERRRIRRR